MLFRSNTRNLQFPAAILQRPPQTVADQGKHHDPWIVGDVDEDLLDLTRRAHQGPVVLFRFDAFELRQTGARDAMDGLTGCIGNEVQMYANGSISQLGIRRDDRGITGGDRRGRDSMRLRPNFIRVLP